MPQYTNQSPYDQWLERKIETARQRFLRTRDPKHWQTFLELHYLTSPTEVRRRERAQGLRR